MLKLHSNGLEAIYSTSALWRHVLHVQATLKFCSVYFSCLCKCQTPVLDTDSLFSFLQREVEPHLTTRFGCVVLCCMMCFQVIVQIRTCQDQILLR